MDTDFTNIVSRLAQIDGKDALLDPKKAKTLLADRSKNEFQKERHLLLIAIESGAAKEIAGANDLAACKKIQIRTLKEDRFIDETAAAEVIDLLAFVLRGDRNVSVPQTPPPPSPSPAPPAYQPPHQQPSNNHPPRRRQQAPAPPPPQKPSITFGERIGFGFYGAFLGALFAAIAGAILFGLAKAVTGITDLVALGVVLGIGGAFFGAIAGGVAGLCVQAYRKDEFINDIFGVVWKTTAAIIIASFIAFKIGDSQIEPCRQTSRYGYSFKNDIYDYGGTLQECNGRRADYLGEYCVFGGAAIGTMLGLVVLAILGLKKRLA